MQHSVIRHFLQNLKCFCSGREHGKSGFGGGQRECCVSWEFLVWCLHPWRLWKNSSGERRELLWWSGCLTWVPGVGGWSLTEPCPCLPSWMEAPPVPACGLQLWKAAGVNSGVLLHLCTPSWSGDIPGDTLWLPMCIQAPWHCWRGRRRWCC